jgi:hypothetical protein
MENVGKQLDRSVKIVKMWGNSQLPNGKTLNEQLTIGKLSLWEVMLPVIALYHAPVALTLVNLPFSLKKRFRPHISLAKRRVLNFNKRIKSRSGCEDWPGEPVFLFVGFSGYMYRDVLHPVAEYLATNKKQQVVSMHDELYERNAPTSMNSILSQSIWQHWNREVANEANFFHIGLKAAIDEIQAMAILPRIIKYEGGRLWPQMQNAFQWLFYFHFPLMVPQVAIALHILKHHRPALLISSDVADPRSRLYCLLGSQMNVPSLEIQLGPGGPRGVEWRFLDADKVASWGEMSHEVLLKHGVKSEKIAVTGSPRHDKFVNVSATEVARTRSRFGIPEGKFMLLCASTYQQKEYNALSNPELLISMKRAVFQAGDEIDGLCLLVKPHPLENVEETKKLVDAGSNIIFANSDEDISELIKACDAFVGFGSTATIDALVANKLIICPSFKGWIWSDIFVKSHVGLVPRSKEEVVKSFQTVVNGSLEKVLEELSPARQKFLKKWVHKDDGKSSKRVAEMAIAMVGDNA